MTEQVAITSKGVEAYWRSKIAEEIRVAMMPLCVCDRCDNYAEAALVQKCIETIRDGRK